MTRSEQQFRRKLQRCLWQALQHVLADMRLRRDQVLKRKSQTGWWDPELDWLTAAPAYPTTLDINQGQCVWFADEVARLMYDERVYPYWIPEELGDHCVVRVEFRTKKGKYAKYFDAEVLRGVWTIGQLPFVLNMGRGREEILRERGQWPINNGGLPAQGAPSMVSGPDRRVPVRTHSEHVSNQRPATGAGNGGRRCT